MCNINVCLDFVDILITHNDFFFFFTQEFLLSPTQFGVPNSRLRYYLLARLSTESFPFTTSQEVIFLHFCLYLLFLECVYGTVVIERVRIILLQECIEA